MKINPGKKRDLWAKCDYPTAGWLNHIHVSLQDIGLEKSTLDKGASDYATDNYFFPALDQLIPVGGRRLGFTL